MKVAQINATCDIGSTGKICKDLSRFLSNNSVNNILFYSEGAGTLAESKRYSNTFIRKAATIYSKITGRYGFENCLETKRLISCLKKYNPDIVHLRNVHNHTFNLKQFFRYAHKANFKIVWSFDDCWPMTGLCTHFDYINCKKWQNHCHSCPLYKEYSFFIDSSKKNHLEKIEIYKDIDFTIIVPSCWMESVVKQSCLSSKKVFKLNYGLDLDIFKPLSIDLKTKYGLPRDSIVLLFVAYNYTEKKGVLDFLKITELASKDKNIYIFVVGNISSSYLINNENVKIIHRTSNQFELCELYNLADVYVNTTKEETFGMTNLESIACCTPVVTYNSGGSPEILEKTKCGVVVQKNDYETLYLKALEMASKKQFLKPDCLQLAQEYDVKKSYLKYLNLYEKIINGGA